MRRSDYTADAGPAEKIQMSQTAQAETAEDKEQYPIGRLLDNAGEKQETSKKAGVISRDGGTATHSSDPARAPAADEKISAGKPSGGITLEAVSRGKAETAAVRPYSDKTDAAGEAVKAPDKKTNGPLAADTIMHATGISAQAAPAQAGKLSEPDAIQDAFPKEPALQILDGIRQQEGKKDAQFSLQLSPEGLGKVSVQMTWQENKMKLTITAHSLQTEALLQQQAPALRSAMESSHIELDRLEFGAGMDAAHEFVAGNGPGGGFGGASAWEQDSGGTAAPYVSIYAAPAAQKTQESAIGYPAQAHVLDCIA